jgi:hypothetical protein
MSTIQNTQATATPAHATSRVPVFASLALLVVIGAVVAILALSGGSSDSTSPSSAAAPAGAVTPAKLYPGRNDDRGNAVAHRFAQLDEQSPQQQQPELQTPGPRP